MSDIDRLRRTVSLSDTAEGFGVKLIHDGDERLGCCPFHNEDTPSFTVFRGKDGVERFHCFGCGERGDVVDFVMQIKGVQAREAIKILGGSATSRPNVAPTKTERPDHYAGITIADPAGDEIRPGVKVTLYNPKRKGTEREWGSFAPSMVFTYRRLDGSFFGYVLRHDLPGGKKETPMVMWVRLPGGRECWCRFPFPTPRPLYGAHAIGDAKQVIVAEGEKCRDALRRATGRAVVSWPGGTYGVDHADWSPLRGRDVVVWPDADGPGFATADRVAGICDDMGCRVRVLDIPRA